MRNLKLMLGITAFVAVMSLMMVACKEDPISAPPPDADFNLSADYGRYVGYPITATIIDLKIDGEDGQGGKTLITIPFPDTAPAHNPTSLAADKDKVVIFWVKADAEIYKNRNMSDYQTYLSGLSSATGGNFYSQLECKSTSPANISTEGRLFKPTATGTYVAGIVDSQGFKDWTVAPPSGGTPTGTCPTPLFSNEITIGTEPNDADFLAKKEFLGKWEMGYFFEPNDQPGKGAHWKEIVKIGPDLFRVFLNQPWVEKDDKGNDVEKGYEGIQFEIASWKKLESNELTGKSVPNPNTGTVETNKTFLTGYKLELGKELLNQNYTTYKSFFVYKDYDTTTLFMARTREDGAIVRSYLTQTKPTDTGIMTEDWSVTGTGAPTTP